MSTSNDDETLIILEGELVRFELFVLEEFSRVGEPVPFKVQGEIRQGWYRRRCKYDSNALRDAARRLLSDKGESSVTETAALTALALPELWKALETGTPSLDFAAAMSRIAGRIPTTGATKVQVSRRNRDAAKRPRRSKTINPLHAAIEAFLRAKPQGTTWKTVRRHIGEKLGSKAADKVNASLVSRIRRKIRDSH